MGDKIYLLANEEIRVATKLYARALWLVNNNNRQWTVEIIFLKNE